MTDPKSCRFALARLFAPVALIFASAALCWGDEPTRNVEKVTAARVEVAPAVRSLFRQRCQSCHQSDGTGNGADAPDFTNDRWHKGRTDAQLLVSILDGKGDGMPAFRGKVTDGQARELVTLTRSFAKNGAAAAEDFASRFRQLQVELATLQKQFRELAVPTGTARARR
jgi:mono/diheme cytochrome c family protein